VRVEWQQQLALLSDDDPADGDSATAQITTNSPTQAYGLGISLVLEGLNATGSKDVIGTRCEGSVGCSNQSIGPIVVPSLGVEAGL
jgi:hypothetical protein